MLDATLSWTKSLTGTPTAYIVTWSHNGVTQPAITVTATAALDASGYTSDFVTSNPGIAVKAGDVIGATVDAFDATSNLTSAVISSTPPTVTEPAPPVPPGPPQNVVLVLS